MLSRAVPGLLGVPSSLMSLFDHNPVRDALGRDEGEGAMPSTQRPKTKRESWCELLAPAIREIEADLRRADAEARLRAAKPILRDLDA